MNIVSLRAAAWLLVCGAALVPIVAANAQKPPGEEPALSPVELAHADGAQIFRHVCEGCHMPDAHGATGAGHYPALAGDPDLASARFAATTVLYGRGNMPSFVPHPNLHGFDAMQVLGLSDAQIASVVNYVRDHFGNHYSDKLTAADVRALHVPVAQPPRHKVQ
jgi:mono/diheme cytochrome c family protein